MERTIDGIDYIAKSEVLRIIDDEVRDAERTRGFFPYGSPYHQEWTIRIMCLRSLRSCLADMKER